MVEALITFADGISLDEVFVIAAGFVAIAAALKILLNAISRQTERLDHFFDDWHGTPASPGRSERLGVMQRLQRIDGELGKNGGTTLKDAVDRTERTLEKLIENKVAEHREIRDSIDELRSDLAEVKSWDAASRIEALGELGNLGHAHAEATLDYILKALSETREKERKNEQRAIAAEGVMGYSSRGSDRDSGRVWDSDQRGAEGHDS